jgi:ribosome-associated protein
VATDTQILISHSLKIPIAELIFRTSRSSGPGGQNVNKLETRVELLFDITHSPNIPEFLRQRIISKLQPDISSSGVLRIVVQDSRSQWKNKQIAVKKLIGLLKSAIVIPKKRIATKPAKSAKENRLRSKKITSERKKLRRIVLE